MQSLVCPEAPITGAFFMLGSCDMSPRPAYGTNPSFPPLIEGPVAGPLQFPSVRSAP
jgi:hypothetical protein